MKRAVLVGVASFFVCLPSFVMAQTSDYSNNHVEVGVFADYFRLSATDPDINFVGIGGRAGFNVHPNIQLEAEMAYDFKRNFTATTNNGISTQFVAIRTRPVTGLFGPKFQAGTSGPFRAFVTGKVGFVNFSSEGALSTEAFENQIEGITNSSTRFALYPGGGVEAFWGPFGLRAEIGDEIYFDNGARNNLKITFGPVFRF